MVNEGPGEGNSGVSRIRALENFPRLIVKDFRDDVSMPTVDAFRQASFPMSMLDEDVICPCKTIPPTTLSARSSGNLYS